MNEGDQTLAKITFTLDSLMDKYEELQQKLQEVSGKHRKSIFIRYVNHKTRINVVN
jgi:hypothetical protein